MCWPYVPKSPESSGCDSKRTVIWRIPANTIESVIIPLTSGSQRHIAIIIAACAVAALLALGGCAAKAQTPTHGIQGASINLAVAARGKLWVRFDSVGHPYTFDARKLHFTWSPYGPYGSGPSYTMTPANVSIGRWERVDRYPRWQPTGSDQFIDRQYRAPIDLGAMQAPGMYRLTVTNDLDLGRTDHGEALSVQNRRVADVYFPDERNDDPAVAELRGRIIGRNVYAFGSSLGPMNVTNVTRSSGDAMMSYGLPAHESVNQFVAIQPILVTFAGGQPYRFADPWQVGVTITTHTPPPNLSSTITVGTTRSEVVWSEGYPDEYGTAQYFNALDVWYYENPGDGVIEFKQDRVATVVLDRPPGTLLHDP